jgi:hypothetical protein
MGVRFLMDILERSPRLLNEMEEGKYYEVLTYILRTKPDFVTPTLLDTLLCIVGRDIERPS